jgi:hypothetical protein
MQSMTDNATKQQQQPEPVSGKTVNSERLLPRPRVILSLPVYITTHPHRCMHTERMNRRRRRAMGTTTTTTKTTLAGTTVWGRANNYQ